jgi:hypothetical protein
MSLLIHVLRCAWSSRIRVYCLLPNAKACLLSKSDTSLRNSETHTRFANAYVALPYTLCQRPHARLPAALPALGRLAQQAARGAPLTHCHKEREAMIEEFEKQLARADLSPPSLSWRQRQRRGASSRPGVSGVWFSRPSGQFELMGSECDGPQEMTKRHADASPWRNNCLDGARCGARHPE